MPTAEQCFVIFEGGGAKGITHLGALKALEEVDLKRIGAAGTSAGAIIAALTAVGYGADELYEPSTGDNILSRHQLTPIDLLGAPDWTVFRRVQGRSPTPAGSTRARRWMTRLLMALCTLIPTVVWLWVLAIGRTTRWPPLLGILWRVVESLGFFTTESARDLLNELLRDKLEALTGVPAPDHVTFADLDPVRVPATCSLKIIATNLSTGRMELFDRATPTIVVADAVAASFSIPGFFKPTRIRHLDPSGRLFLSADIYADGGLVSNLPVWAFSEEKRSVERLKDYRENRPLPIIAFTLSGSKPNPTSSQVNPFRAFGDHLKTVVSTGVFGGQSIVEGFVPHLTVVEMPSPLTVVEFDCSAADARKAYEQGYGAALEQLQSVFRVNPFAREEILADLRDGALRRIANLRAAAHAQPVTQLRACLLRQLGNQSFKVIASLGMEMDADDDLVVDKGNLGGPLAFATRDITYLDPRAVTSLRMTKYERALVRPTLASVLSVPIFRDPQEWNKDAAARSTPLGVFCLDSDSDLSSEAGDIGLRSYLAVGATSFAAFMRFERETG